MEYYFGVELGDFNASELNCSNLNSHLVVISSQSVQSFVETTMRQIAGRHHFDI